MATEERMRIMVTVKAYPALSNRRGETVCVAGVRIDSDQPKWVRLYPVAYRDLPQAQRFSKYQIIDVRVRKSTDARPESFSPNLASLATGAEVSSDRGWRGRWELLGGLVGGTTTCALLLAQDGAGIRPSLGLIKPDVVDLIVEPNEAFDADRRALAELAAAENLLQEAKSVLEPAPYRLTYVYRCQGESACGGHRQTCIDWESGEAARRWSREGYPLSQIADMLRNRFLDQMCSPDRDAHFYVGNQHLYPRGFLVLGVFWPPAGSRPQPVLF